MAEKILIIDDDVDTLKLVGMMLQKQGYSIVAANNGPQGLEQAEKEAPDLILLDVMMPGMTGLETCRLLRAEMALRDTPIILLTASDDPDLDAKGRQAGATASMRKPFGSANIISAVEQALGRRLDPFKC
jgi:CheY-like chemotaxis protein